MSRSLLLRRNDMQEHQRVGPATVTQYGNPRDTEKLMCRFVPDHKDKDVKKPARIGDKSQAPCSAALCCRAGIPLSHRQVSTSRYKLRLGNDSQLGVFRALRFLGSCDKERLVSGSLVWGGLGLKTGQQLSLMRTSYHRHRLIVCCYRPSLSAFLLSGM